MKEYWDKRYSEHEFVYGQAPNSFFKEFIDKEKPGSILLPAEGEGRHAIYAAAKGWEVFATDYSKVAQQKALARAKSLGLSIHYEVDDLANWESKQQVDCIVLIYAHFSPENRESVHKKLISYLKPGGKIMLEAFTKDQLKYNTGGPGNIDMLFDSDMLRQDFETLSINLLEEKITKLDESEFHSGNASLIRMIAHKN